MQLIHVTKRLARFLVCSVLFFALPLMADTEEIDGYTWSYRIIGDTAEIYNNGGVAISPAPTGSIQIPAILGGKPVTSIGEYAFYSCRGLTSVTIPDGVMNIGDSAFSDCRGMTSATIPDSVTSLGNYAFYGCNGLADDDGLVIVGGVLFYYYDSGENIGEEKNVTIPANVTSIGGRAFRNRWLTSVTIPNSVTNIGDYAFYGCSGLTSVTISNDVARIGNQAFSDCSGLADNNGFVIVGGILFNYWGDEENITIPDGVTSIGNEAFSYSWVKSVAIPNSVIDIGFRAFEDCSELRSVTIPDGVASIKDYTFSDCVELTSVTIPGSVRSIGKSAFSGCSSLTSVEIGNGVTNIGWSAFYCCSRLMNVTIPDSVTSIGGCAFANCSGLVSVTIPDDVTSIGNGAFADCSSLINVVISAGVTCIEDNVFSGCRSLLNMTIPNSVTSIGRAAFYGCSKLTNMMIPASVGDVGDDAFSYCSGLTSVVFAGDCPCFWLYSMFDNVNPDCCVYVSRNSDGWGVDIPGVWQGLPIRYIDEMAIYTVVFDLGKHGKRTGGGLEVQTVMEKGTVMEPKVKAEPGWVFVGWDTMFESVTSNMTVKAQWRRAAHEDVWGEWSVPEGATYTMPESILSFTELSRVVWRARDAYVKTGVKTEVPPSEGAIVLSLGAVAVPDSLFADYEPVKTDIEHGAEVWRMRVFEDSDTSSLVCVVGATSFKIADVPSYRDDLWVREVYGSPPSWLDGEDEERWFAMRSRKRIGWFVTLVPQSKWGTYCVAQAGNAKATKGEGPPQLSVTGIEVDPLTAIHKVSVESTEEGTTWVLGADNLSATNWMYSGLALQPCGISSAGTYSDSSNQFFKAVFSPTAADGDGDGIPDVLEEKVYGTNPNKADSSGDGLSDWDKLFRYGLNPLAKDTDEDGLDDGEEIMAGSDPNVPAAADTQNAVQTSIRYYYDEDDRLVGTYIGQGAGRSRITLSPAGNSTEIQKEGK